MYSMYVCIYDQLENGTLIHPSTASVPASIVRVAFQPTPARPLVRRRTMLGDCLIAGWSCHQQTASNGQNSAHKQHLRTSGPLRQAVRARREMWVNRHAAREGRGVTPGRSMEGGCRLGGRIGWQHTNTCGHRVTICQLASGWLLYRLVPTEEVYSVNGTPALGFTSSRL
jgi:hypothetical protein